MIFALAAYWLFIFAIDVARLGWAVDPASLAAALSTLMWGICNSYIKRSRAA